MTVYKIKKALTTTSTAVDDLIHWMREQLDSVSYGEVGLVFTMHNSAISRAKKIKVDVQKVGNEREGHAELEVNETNFENYNGRGYETHR